MGRVRPIAAPARRLKNDRSGAIGTGAEVPSACPRLSMTAAHEPPPIDPSPPTRAGHPDQRPDAATTSATTTPTTMARHWPTVTQRPTASATSPRSVTPDTADSAIAANLHISGGAGRYRCSVSPGPSSCVVSGRHRRGMRRRFRWRAGQAIGKRAGPGPLHPHMLRAGYHGRPRRRRAAA
jgi:hypothetical protein